MTDQRKDEIEAAKKDADTLKHKYDADENHFTYWQGRYDGLCEAQNIIASPPVPDDVVKAVKTLRIILDQPHAFHFGDNTRLCIETLIRAASTPSAEVRALRTALEDCRNQFRFYAKNHLSKSPPDTDKAKSNNHMADMCEEALNQPHTGGK